MHYCDSTSSSVAESKRVVSHSVSTNCDPHARRAAAILARYPQVKSLYGNEPYTAFYGIVCVALHLALAFATASSYVRAALLALTVGPFLVLGLLTLQHEASHHLVFRTPKFNHMLGIFVNMPMCVPLFETFVQHHKAHHYHLGSPDFDVDVPTQAEAQFVGHSAWRKAVWVLLHFALLPLRSMFRLGVMWDGWMVISHVVILGFAAVVLLCSPAAFGYLLLSTVLSQSLHPANARSLQRHVHPTAAFAEQPVVCISAGAAEAVAASGAVPNTYSYYSTWSWLTLNVGYHVEHHDFPHIPWTKLPELHAIAREFYVASPSHNSRGASSMLDFVVNDSVTLEHFWRRAGDGGATSGGDGGCGEDGGGSNSKRVLTN